MAVSRARVSMLLLCLAGAGVAVAGPPDPWRWSVDAGLLHQAETSLDTGGDVKVDRFFARGGGSRKMGDDLRVGVSLGLGQDRYDFSGASGFGGLDPWERVRRVRLSAPVQYKVNDDWMLFGSPSLRFDAESDASLGDGQTIGLIAGASYRVSERLTLGPGLGISSELEDDMSIFPLLIVDWEITDNLRLETGGHTAAMGGPGLQLRWTYSPAWEFAIGGRYEKRRFRLDDTGVAPGGVGEDKAVPVYGFARFSLSKDAELMVLAGARVAGSLRVENAAGQGISESDLSTAPFFGGSVRLRF